MSASSSSPVAARVAVGSGVGGDKVDAAILALDEILAMARDAGGPKCVIFGFDGYEDTADWHTADWDTQDKRTGDWEIRADVESCGSSELTRPDMVDPELVDPDQCGGVSSQIVDPVLVASLGRRVDDLFDLLRVCEYAVPVVPRFRRSQKELMRSAAFKKQKRLRSLMREVESLLCAFGALQSEVIVAYDRVTRDRNKLLGLPVRDQGRGIDRGVAFATRCSPNRAARMVSVAKSLTSELPNTRAALSAGRISVYRAEIIATEAQKLPTRPRRELFDKRLCSDAAEVETLGVRSLRRRAQALVDELHPATASERFAAEAKASCHVQVDELGSGMSRLMAVLPSPHAAYIYSVLDAAATGNRILAVDPATGNVSLPRGQAMAQALYQQFNPPAPSRQEMPEVASAEPTNAQEFANAQGLSDLPGAAEGLSAKVFAPGDITPPITGHGDPASGVTPPGMTAPGVDLPGVTRPDGIAPGDTVREFMAPTNTALGDTVPGNSRIGVCGGVGVVPVTIDLVISDRALLGYGEESAHVLAAGARKNCGTIPATVARALIANGIDLNVAWLRKLYVNSHGALVATSSRQRFHPEGLARMLRLRDQGVCRTPWCDAAIRHADHVVPWSRGGPTSLENGASLCVRCNQTKDAPGWTAKPETDPQTGRQTITYTDSSGNEENTGPPTLPKPA